MIRRIVLLLIILLATCAWCPGDSRGESSKPPTVPGATPPPTVPDESAPPGILPSRHDPWYLVSRYDAGDCPNPSSGWGWSGSLSWPTDSHDIHPRRGFRKGHPAIDILTSLGSPVYAAETGVVIWAGYNTWGYGNLIILNHGGGWLTFYAHLGGVSVGCGQTVGRGAVIGTIGQTGSSSFPHLHFELRRSNYNYNPLNRLPEVLVEVGDRVQANDPLARVDSEQLALQVQQAEATLTR